MYGTGGNMGPGIEGSGREEKASRAGIAGIAEGHWIEAGRNWGASGETGVVSIKVIES